MGYQLLGKAYYQGQEEYEQLFQTRYHSEAAIHIDFPALSPTCFCVQTRDLSDKMVRIYRLDKQIYALRKQLPGVAIEQFTRRCLIDEIVLTNSIEGVNSTRRDIGTVLDELEKKTGKKRFHGLVQKYSMLQHAETVKLDTCQDIREIYDELVLDEVREEDPKDVPDGEIFRGGPVSVYSPTQKEIHKGLFPEKTIQEAMEKLLAFLKNEEVDPLIRIAVVHYLMGYIHPFYNGNGRLSRFISSYLLARDMEPLMSYRLSYTIKERIKEYYGAFQICNDPHDRGDLTPFVSMFLHVLCEAAEQLKGALEKRKEKLYYYKGLLEKRIPEENKAMREIGFLLIQAQLFSENGIPTKDLLQVCNISKATLAKRLASFKEQNLLVEKRVGKEKCYGIDLLQLEK